MSTNKIDESADQSEAILSVSKDNGGPRDWMISTMLKITHNNQKKLKTLIIEPEQSTTQTNSNLLKNSIESSAGETYKPIGFDFGPCSVNLEIRSPNSSNPVRSRLGTRIIKSPTTAESYLRSFTRHGTDRPISKKDNDSPLQVYFKTDTDKQQLPRNISRLATRVEAVKRQSGDRYNQLNVKVYKKNKNNMLLIRSISPQSFSRTMLTASPNTVQTRTEVQESSIRDLDRLSPVPLSCLSKITQTRSNKKPINVVKSLIQERQVNSIGVIYG